MVKLHPSLSKIGVAQTAYITEDTEIVIDVCSCTTSKTTPLEKYCFGCYFVFSII